MQPDLSILPRPQRNLFPELAATPEHFTLYGGTAIALYLGHRESVDFDFFSNQPFDPDELYAQVPYLHGAEVTQKEEDTLTCIVDRQGPVKVSYFGGLGLACVEPPNIVDKLNFKIASLIDLAGMKVAVVQKRAVVRDYIDLEALMTIAQIDLSTALASGAIIYGNQFNPAITLKALTYFEEGELRELPKKVQDNLRQAVEVVQLEEIHSRILQLQNNKGAMKC